jgi:hypothetical protein
VQELTRLFNPDRITATDRASALDCRVDSDADLVVLRRRAQDARIRALVDLLTTFDFPRSWRENHRDAETIMGKVDQIETVSD